MRKIILSFGVVAALAGVWGTPARAETIALLPAQGINIEAGTLQASRDVLEGHLSRSGRFRVVLVGDPSIQELAPEQAVRAAAEAKADLAAILRITRLGSNSRVRLIVYRVPSGEVHYNGDLVATSADDMDPVLKRLAMGLGSNASPNQVATLGTLTEGEAPPPIVHTVRVRGGASVLTMLALNRPSTSRSPAAAGVSAFVYFDAEWMMGDAFAELLGHAGNLILNLGVGAYRPLSAGSVAPYVGGAMRFSAATYGGAGGSGISPEATLGLILGRTSSSQLRLQASYFVNLFPEAPSTSGTVMPTGGSKYVQGVIFSFGICTRV